MAFRSMIAGPLAIPQASDGLIIARPDGTQRRTINSDNVDSYAWNSTSDGLLYTVHAASGQPSELWESSLDGVSRPLAIAVDASTFGTTNGFALHGPIADHQVLGPPTFPPVTTAPTVSIGTPLAAKPVDVTGDWPTLAADAEGGCRPVIVDTKTGTDTTVAILCDQGTLSVSSAAWSPDGSTYAAVMTDSLGDGTLNLVRSDGMVAPKVADLHGLSSVAWSPDGRWVTAVGDQTHLLRPDGTVVNALPGTPSWTPDGRHLVVSMVDGTLLVGGPDGSDLRSIGSFPPPSAWALDGSRFAFARHGDVWTAAADGTDLRNITAFPLGGAGSVAWSPDGRWIAVAPGRGLWLMRPDGTDRRFIDLGLAVGIARLIWSPDGQRLAAETYISGGNGADDQVILLAADGSSATAIASAGGPVWSPDGRFIAVVNSSGSGYDVMNADGTGRTPLTGVPSGNSDFAWIR